MRFLLLFVLFSLGSASLGFSQHLTERTEAVFFETDAYVLTPEAQKLLDELATDLLSRPEYTLKIDAHTDDRGTVRYNEQLARNRAVSVERYLNQKGVDVRKIEVLSHGELAPRYTNADEQGRQRNRRVDLVYSFSTLASVDDLLNQLSTSQTEIIDIDPTVNTRVIGSQGTSVWIPANSLVLPDGSTPSGTVQIQLEESYDIFDMITEGLMTHSGDQILETGGMISVQAFADGQALSLDSDQALTIALPGSMRQPGMELFMGVTDAQGNVADWDPTQRPFESSLADVVDLPPPPTKKNIYFKAPQYNEEWAGYPKKPTKPKMPREPREVKRESIRYNPGFIKRVALGKEKIEQQEEAMYQQALEDYKERYRLYEQKMDQYTEDLANFGQAKINHKLDMEAWKAQRIKDSLSYDPEGAIYEAKLAAYEANCALIDAEYQKQLEIWREVKRRRLTAFEEEYDLAGTYQPNVIYQYFTQVNELGWINCDRFYNVPAEEKVELAIKDLDPEQDERVFVVFEEINSILKATKNGPLYTTSKVPLQAPVRIIGLKVVDGKAFLAELETVVGAAGEYELEYRPCSLVEMAEALERNNRPS